MDDSYILITNHSILVTQSKEMESDPIYQSIASHDASFCALIKMIPKDVYYHTATADGMTEDDDVSNRYNRKIYVCHEANV